VSVSVSRKPTDCRRASRNSLVIHKPARYVFLEKFKAFKTTIILLKRLLKAEKKRVETKVKKMQTSKQRAQV